MFYERPFKCFQESFHCPNSFILSKDQEFFRTEMSYPLKKIPLSYMSKPPKTHPIERTQPADSHAMTINLIPNSTQKKAPSNNYINLHCMEPRYTSPSPKETYTHIIRNVPHHTFDNTSSAPQNWNQHFRNYIRYIYAGFV